MAEPNTETRNATPARVARVRPPRVQITYDIEVGDAIEKKELPFVVGVLADLTVQPTEALPRLRDRKFVEISNDNFDDVLDRMRPHLAFNVENRLSEDPDSRLNCDLNFKSLSDFEPQNVARQIRPLHNLIDRRVDLADLRGIVVGNERLEEFVLETLNRAFSDTGTMRKIEMELSQDGPETSESWVPDESGAIQVAVDPRTTMARIWDESGASQLPDQRQRGVMLLKTLFREVLVDGAITVSRDLEAMINGRLAQIDHLLSLQLNEIVHSAEFQRLEGTWRGLQYLLNQTRTGWFLKIRVLNVSKRDLLRDLQRAPEVDESALFKKVYEEEFGIFGGMPYSVLVGDYYFGRAPEDMELLEKLSDIAAAAHAPFIGGAAPELFNLESFLYLHQPRDLAKIFDNTEYAKWKSLRRSENSKYLGLVLPRILLRMPYGHGGQAIEEFAYEEGVDGTDHEKYLWGNGVFAFASRLTAAFDRFGWTAAIRGVEGGGLVEKLPVHTFITDNGDVAMKCPAEIAISDRREGELSKLGFIPLVHCKGTDYACFFTANSVYQPRIYDRDYENASARQSAELPYTFASARFMHYLKAMMRDKIGSFMSRSDAEQFLNQWIANYVLADDEASQTIRAERPLRQARIEVLEIPGKPGAYRAVAQIQPNFQLEPEGAPIRSVAELPQSGK